MVSAGAIAGRRLGGGFTLIELLIVLAIVGVIATLATPSFSELISSSRIRSSTVDLHSTLTFARSEAIKRNSDVDIAPASGGWNNGWSVKLSGGGTVLRSQDALPGSISVSGPTGALTYRRDGRLTTAPSLPTFSVFVSGNNNVVRRCVNVSVSGQPSVQYDKNADGDCTNG